MNQFLDADIA